MNTVYTEKRLDQLIETPVAQYRSNCAAGAPPDTIPWDVHRALFLFVLFQLPRVVEAIMGKSSTSLDDVFLHTDAELGSLVRQLRR